MQAPAETEATPFVESINSTSDNFADNATRKNLEKMIIIITFYCVGS